MSFGADAGQPSGVGRDEVVNFFHSTQYRRVANATPGITNLSVKCHTPGLPCPRAAGTLYLTHLLACYAFIPLTVYTADSSGALPIGGVAISYGTSEYVYLRGLPLHPQISGALSWVGPRNAQSESTGYTASGIKMWHARRERVRAA